MNPKHLINFLVILLIITSATLVVAFMRPANTKIINSAREDASVYRTDPLISLQASFYTIYPTLVTPDDGILIKGTDSLMTERKRRVSLRSLIGNKTKLIFRYSYMDCDICVDSVISQVKKITQRAKLNDFLIITDTRTERDFLLKSNYKKHPFPIYGLLQSKLGLTMENKNLPFLFVISPDLRISKIFIPFKESPYQTEQYLDYIFHDLKTI